MGAWILLVGIKATGVAELSLWKLVTFWGLAVVLITLGRALARMLCRRSASYVQNTVIVGTGRIAERIARKIQQHPEYGLQFVGYVDGPAGDTNGHGVAKSPQEWRLLVHFLAFTGLRVGEALALQCRHVDFGRRRVLVRRRVYEGRFAKPKSSYGRRDVPVSAAIKAARDESDDGLVFCRDDGGLIHPSTVLRAVQDAGGKAGVPWVTTHCLRHTCATMLFRKGVNPKQAQVWLGHHSPAFTLAVYTHLIDSDCPTRT